MHDQNLGVNLFDSHLKCSAL